MVDEARPDTSVTAMDWLCGGGQDWHRELFWRPGGPDLRPCTKDVLLPLLPAAILLLVTPFEVRSWRRRGPGWLGVTCHWLGKVLAVVGLAGVRLAELGLGHPDTSQWWLGAVVEVVAYFCFMVLLIISRRSAITTVVFKGRFDRN